VAGPSEARAGGKVAEREADLARIVGLDGDEREREGRAVLDVGDVLEVSQAEQSRQRSEMRGREHGRDGSSDPERVDAETELLAFEPRRHRDRERLALLDAVVEEPLVAR